MREANIADVFRWVDQHRLRHHDAQLLNIGIGGYGSCCHTCRINGPYVIFDLAQLKQQERSTK